MWSGPCMPSTACRYCAIHGGEASLLLTTRFDAWLQPYLVPSHRPLWLSSSSRIAVANGRKRAV